MATLKKIPTRFSDSTSGGVPMMVESLGAKIQMGLFGGIFTNLRTSSTKGDC